MTISDIISELNKDRSVKKIKETFRLQYFEQKGKLIIVIGCKNKQGHIEDTYTFESNENGYIHPGQAIVNLATAWDIGKSVGSKEEKKKRL